MQRFRFLFLVLNLVCASLLLAPPMQAQPASAPASTPATEITLGQSIVPLNGPWKFHIGDNPAWADPNFDDSGWETVDLTPKSGSFGPIAGLAGYVPGWTAKGHPGYSGYAWYRIRVRVAAPAGQKLALTGPANVDDAYQVFADGRLLGGFGKFPQSGPPVMYESQPRIFALPQPQENPAGTRVLAFRVWMDPSTLTTDPDAGGMHTAPLLGEAGVVRARYQLDWLAQVRASGSAPIDAAIFLLLAVLALSLRLFDPADPVYLWLAGLFLLIAADTLVFALGVWTELLSGETVSLLLHVLLRPLILGGWAMLWWVWFRLRRPPWVPLLIAGLVLVYGLADGVAEHLLLAGLPAAAVPAFHALSLAARLLFLALLVWIVVRGVWQQGREGWLALPAVVLVGIAQFETELRLLHLRVNWFPFGVVVTLGQIALFLLVGAIGALLVRRALLSVRRQREMTLDVKQAQEVQQVLIPMALPPVPGLTIESEYRPAQQVGGDFFQILPNPADESVLLVAGDVTGHGLQAGMLVALIVGAIRNQASHSHDPLIMLQKLNERLLGREQANATCLALRIGRDGACTLANAGHLPPYVNGKEIPMPGALPLGMIEGAEFSLMNFRVNEGDRLILMSDGVAEAMDEDGQIFGFERINELLQKNLTAAQIADATQKFGQQDDITVLLVVREAKVAERTEAEPALAIG
jgi:hypothetical protein